MRILFVHHHPGIIGGTEKYLRSMMLTLAGRGHEVAFLHGYEPDPVAGKTPMPDRGVSAWCLETLGTEETVRIVTSWSPSVVYIHSWQLPEVEKILLDRYPCALFVHDYHRTCPTGTKMWSFPDRRSCPRRAGAACLAMHYPRRCGGLNPLTVLRNYQRQKDQLELIPHYRAVLVASRYLYHELSLHGVSSDCLHLTPLFPPEMSPDPLPPVARRIRGKILAVGRLVASKGMDLLIRALKEAGLRLGLQLHLTIAGNGPDEAALRKLAKSLGADVEFSGWLDQPPLADLMRDSDLLAFPSIWPEPFGLNGLEAGCVGLPSVAFDVGGIRDWLKPGYSGELAPGSPPTPENLARAIARALGDPDHHTRLRRGAWETANEFTKAAHLARLESVLEGIHDHRPVWT
jgi:glycosyltransferase involved in cell wall biosynthesis